MGQGRRAQERGAGHRKEHDISKKDPWSRDAALPLSLKALTALIVGFSGPSAAWQLNIAGSRPARSGNVAPQSRTSLISNSAIAEGSLEDFVPLRVRKTRKVEEEIEEDFVQDFVPLRVRKTAPSEEEEFPLEEGKAAPAPSIFKRREPSHEPIQGTSLHHGPRLPRIAIVGAPNVGKSTIANWMTGKGAQKSMVYDRPGITRDRVYGEGCWNGRNFTVIDTGGLFYHPNDPFQKEVREQTALAVKEADVVLFVADGLKGLVDTDEEVADLLRANHVPAVLVVNKCDDPDDDDMTTCYFWGLGMGTPMPVSGLYKVGLREMMDELVNLFPREPETGTAETQGAALAEVRVAILGRPNVGKSSLTNRLLGEERMIVSNIAGSTRDAIGHSVYYNGTKFTFIDTAGVRPRKQMRAGVEERTVRRSLKAVREQADVCMLVVDVTQGLSHQESFFARFIAQTGLPSLVVVNKWDTVEDKNLVLYTGTKKNPALAKQLPIVTRNKARPLYVSAATGQRTDEIFRAISAIVQESKHNTENEGETSMEADEEFRERELKLDEGFEEDIEGEVDEEHYEEDEEHYEEYQEHEREEMSLEHEVEHKALDEVDASSVRFDEHEWN